MLINLLVLLLWAPSVLGWGATTRSLLTIGIDQGHPTANPNLGLLMMLGFLPLAFVATALHFFLPITSATALTALIAGYVLLAYQRRAVRSGFSARSVGGALWSMLLVSLFASRPLTHFDTGLYHIQSVKWCTTFPLVRGLANLHERLAFTSVWTPLSALVDYPRFIEGACFPVTCLLLFAFGWAAYTAISNLKNATEHVAEVFLAACGCFWTTMVIAGESLVILPSLSSDAPIYFTTLLCVYFLLRFCSGRESLDLFQALAIAALAVTIKVSAAPLFLFLVVFSAFVWARDTSRLPSKVRMWGPLAAATGLLFAIWTLRSVWLSGYLVFPIPFTALTLLPWHLPVPMAEQLVETLKAWARSPGVSPEIVLSSSRWIPAWLFRFCDENIFYTTLAIALFGGVAMFVSRRKQRSRNVFAQFWPAALMVASGVIYWLLTAPDPRYGYGYLFALACLVFSFGTALLLAENLRLLRIVLCSLTLIPLLGTFDLSRFQLAGLPWMGVGPTSLRQTQSGTGIYVAEGDQRILNGPLPSTPYFRATLSTRFDAEGHILRFELPAPVDVPYYATVPERVRQGLALTPR